MGFGPIEKGGSGITVAAVAVYCVALAQRSLLETHMFGSPNPKHVLQFCPKQQM